MVLEDYVPTEALPDSSNYVPTEALPDTAQNSDNMTNTQTFLKPTKYTLLIYYTI